LDLPGAADRRRAGGDRDGHLLGVGAQDRPLSGLPDHLAHRLVGRAGGAGLDGLLLAAARGAHLVGALPVRPGAVLRLRPPPGVGDRRPAPFAGARYEFGPDGFPGARDAVLLGAHVPDLSVTDVSMIINDAWVCGLGTHVGRSSGYRVGVGDGWEEWGRVVASLGGWAGGGW